MSRESEIKADQAHFDYAAAERDKRIEAAGQAGDAAAHPGAAEHLARHGKLVAEAMGAADAVAFGRMDLQDDRLYVGRHLIRDDQGEVLVVSWKADAAAPFYSATHADPLGVTRKRTYECQGNTIIHFADVVFGQWPERADEFLERVLAQGRTGSMRDIVATIQAAQYDIIRAPLDQMLVIAGGPGTGKTVIALHRVSWLLSREEARLRPGDVLVVGPNTTFTRYIRNVLPDLGDSDVPIRDIAQLAPEVNGVGRGEAPEVAALKGDARMAGMLARSLEARIGEPEPVERLPWDGRFINLPGADIAEIIAECRALALPYDGRRAAFRERLGELVAQRAGQRAVGSPGVGNLLERLWPSQSAPAFLRDLLASRRRLEAAADRQLPATEIIRLYRQGAGRLGDETWSAGDLHLLDELHHLIRGDTPTYRHIVVDEAQDLSPMQLRSVARRSVNGSLTVVGDIAQSTGAWARDDWADVTGHLPDRLPVTVEQLRYGYRVPRPTYELAARLLPVAAPRTEPPRVVRDGPVPRLHQVALHDRAEHVVATALAHLEAGRFVGVICPHRCRREVEAALTNRSVRWSGGELTTDSVNVLSPVEVKGLEFDAVVVVEPEHIVAESDRGLRMLYVALTRTTGFLDIVAVGQTLPLTQPDSVAPAPAPPDDRERRNRSVAAHVVGQIRAATAPEDWEWILAEVARELDL